MSGRFADKTIIITGATKGIGRASAVAVAREGGMSLSPDATRKAARKPRELVGETGRDCLFVPHDVRDETQWEAVFAECAKKYGAPSGLVNNAGVFFVKPLADTTEEDFDAIYQVNVEGTFLGMKHAFRSFGASNTAGAVVNVSSLMGQVGYPNAIAYCATKGAVTAMTKSAALEGGAMTPKVRVNSLHPGVIWTPMITDAFGDDKALADAFAQDTPLRMIGLPEYMADAIVYLLSDDAAYVTGAELTADGGRGAD